MTKSLLLVFTRNPELGKCKTRLAATIGDQAALNIYKFLLDHSVGITKDLKVEKRVYYSEKIRANDLWSDDIYTKKTQIGDDLGERMYNAFKDGFNDGFDKIIIIGSDMYDLSKNDLLMAFEKLNKSDYVIGPAEDGGYYLFGMKELNPNLFINKHWGTSSVLKESLKELTDKNYELLQQRNDVDIYDDIKNNPIFDQFIEGKLKSPN